MTAKRRTLAIVLGLLVPLLGPLNSQANPRSASPYSDLINSAEPCVMTDFRGDAPYPQGFGPTIAIAYPVTGDTVAAGKVYVQSSAYCGWWDGDPTLGGILQIQLFVDGKLTSIWDPTSGKITPLTWNTTKTSKGTHALVLRLYTANFYKTTACYLDSEVEYPTLQ